MMTEQMITDAVEDWERGSGFTVPTALFAAEAERKLREKHFYGPYKCVGRWFFQQTPDVLRGTTSGVQVRGDVHGSIGICRLPEQEPLR